MNDIGRVILTISLFVLFIGLVLWLHITGMKSRAASKSKIDMALTTMTTSAPPATAAVADKYADDLWSVAFERLRPKSVSDSGRTPALVVMQGLHPIIAELSRLNAEVEILKYGRPSTPCEHKNYKSIEPDGSGNVFECIDCGLLKRGR